MWSVPLIAKRGLKGQSQVFSSGHLEQARNKGAVAVLGLGLGICGRCGQEGTLSRTVRCNPKAAVI